MAFEALELDRVHTGSAVDVLSTLPSKCVNTVVTSPPYFGHRKYTGEFDSVDEVGREESVGDYVQRLVKIFEEVRRVLRDDGTLWLNLGDTYRANQLLGVPWRVALALQDDGWLLRSDIIWHKPNAMPSSVKTRPTTDHEYLFLFAKSEKYRYFQDAIREPHKTFGADSKMKGGRNHFGKRGGTPEAGKNGGDSNLHDGRWDQAFHPLGRNRRTVWSVPLSKFRGAHFAVFPEALISPCILAGSQVGDVVLDPFIGSGTTGLVALRHNRHFIGVELVKEYAEIARNRTSVVQVEGLGN
jgi:DNA modification methylase